jgi:hypothetical protein
MYSNTLKERNAEDKCLCSHYRLENNIGTHLPSLDLLDRRYGCGIGILFSLSEMTAVANGGSLKNIGRNAAEAAERRATIEALRLTGGNKQKAAQRLRTDLRCGFSRATASARSASGPFRISWPQRKNEPGFPWHALDRTRFVA